MSWTRVVAARFSGLFGERRLERENERLRQERDETARKRSRDQKRIAELEKENARLKRDLEAKAQPPSSRTSLSTPSDMQPPYSKPPARKRYGKPGRKNGHPGAHRPAPVHIDRTVEHKLRECPNCQNPAGESCGKHTRMVEEIPPVRPKEVLLRNGSVEWQRFAGRVKRLIHEALKFVIDRNRIGEPAYGRRTANLNMRLADIFGISYRDADSERLAKRLNKYREELLTFLLHPDVQAHNNHAERQIRFAVIIRKNYFGNRSMRGAETQAILMSIFHTCHLRGVDLIAVLAKSVAAAIRTGSSLPIPDSPQAVRSG